MRQNKPSHEYSAQIDADTLLAPTLLKTLNCIHQCRCKKRIMEFEKKIEEKVEELRKEEQEFMQQC